MEAARKMRTSTRRWVSRTGNTLLNLCKSKTVMEHQIKIKMDEFLTCVKKLDEVQEEVEVFTCKQAVILKQQDACFSRIFLIFRRCIKYLFASFLSETYKNRIMQTL